MSLNKNSTPKNNFFENEQEKDPNDLHRDNGDIAPMCNEFENDQEKDPNDMYRYHGDNEDIKNLEKNFYSEDNVEINYKISSTKEEILDKTKDLKNSINPILNISMGEWCPSPINKEKDSEIHLQNSIKLIQIFDEKNTFLGKKEKTNHNLNLNNNSKNNNKSNTEKKVPKIRFSSLFKKKDKNVKEINDNQNDYNVDKENDIEIELNEEKKIEFENFYENGLISEKKISTQNDTLDSKENPFMDLFNGDNDDILKKDDLPHLLTIGYNDRNNILLPERELGNIELTRLISFPPDNSISTRDSYK